MTDNPLIVMVEPTGIEPVTSTMPLGRPTREKRGILRFFGADRGRNWRFRPAPVENFAHHSPTPFALPRAARARLAERG